MRSLDSVNELLIIMRKTLLFSLLILFAGVNIWAQNVASEQMDERFNDGTITTYKALN